MAEHPRVIVARWIEERRQERDAMALGWLIKLAGISLLLCYPPGEGREPLWALFRTIEAAEAAEREEG